MPLATTLRHVSVLIFVQLSVTAAANAQTAIDSQFWLQGVAIVSLSDNWRLHLEEQPRWDDDASRVFQVLTRTAIGRRLGARLSVWGGHAWIAKGGPAKMAHEQRLWQQLSATPPAALGWTTLFRLRTEQRWQQEWDGPSHRLRVMGRTVKALSDGNAWSAVGWGESFFAWDDTAGGPPKGFDQLRLFGGAARLLSAHVSVEAGYLHVAARRRIGPIVNTPGALVALNLTF